MLRKSRYPLLVVLSMALAACGSSSIRTASPTPSIVEEASPPPTIAVDVRAYFSVKELRASSDAVLLGTFGKKTGSQRDNGGNPADISGIPIEFHEFFVSRVLSGRDLGPKVQVVALDASSWNGDNISLRPHEGEEVVIFARELSAATAPGVKLSGPTINAVSENNGVLDVSNGRAKARLFLVSINQEPPSTSTLAPAGLPGLLDIDLAELERAVNETP
jgi:hypothetical protein